MPLFLIPIATWLGNAIFATIVWFVSRKGISISIGIGIIALMGTAITFLINRVDGLMGSVMGGAAPFVAPFVPSNMAFCVSAIISTELLCTGYRLTMRLIDTKAKILLA